jgi:hypothetical protein
MLPNYLVIGAAKCGTSSLCHSLGQHPQVFMSRPKEIHFFGRNDPVKTFEWYESFFADAAGKTAVGEGSTSYTHPDIIEACAQEIAEHIPDCRLIYMVRNPLHRLESDWKMRRHDGWAAASVNEAVQEQPSLITHGLYWKNLSVYRRHFRDDQMLIVFFDDFTRDPQTELRRCFEHIGVDPDIVIENAGRPRNAASGYRSYGAIAGRLRHGRFFAAVKRHLPAWVIGTAKSALTKKVEHKPDWDPEVRASVIQSFSEDSQRFLEFCKKSPSHWQTTPGPADSPQTPTSATDGVGIPG